MIIRTRSQKTKFAITLTTEHDDDSDATYLITPHHHCQNPSHAHHYSHHQHGSGYRYPMAETVVEESTGGSIVTVISNTSTIRPNDSTPDIVLTNSESMEGKASIVDTNNDDHHHHHGHQPKMVRSQSIDKPKNQGHDSVDSSKKPMPLPSSSSSSASLSATTAPATEPIPNNETGTDSIQINSFTTNNCKHIITSRIWVNARGLYEIHNNI